MPHLRVPAAAADRFQQTSSGSCTRSCAVLASNPSSSISSIPNALSSIGMSPAAKYHKRVSHETDDSMRRGLCWLNHRTARGIGHLVSSSPHTTGAAVNLRQPRSHFGPRQYARSALLCTTPSATTTHVCNAPCGQQQGLSMCSWRARENSRLDHMNRTPYMQGSCTASQSEPQETLC
jgi:hypothetical protein